MFSKYPRPDGNSYDYSGCVRPFVLIFVLMHCLHLSAQKNIRDVDFKNFTYPLRGGLLGHGSLQWLDRPSAGSSREPIHLVAGKGLTKAYGSEMDEDGPYQGFTLEYVRYADLTGDGNEEAIVDLKYHTGGTQTTDYVYVYTLDQQGPKLLAYCHTGSRAYAGLYKVYGKNGLLVFELLDPVTGMGDCCSSRALVTRYKWQDGVFKQIGPSRRRTLSPPIVHPMN